MEEPRIKRSRMVCNSISRPRRISSTTETWINLEVTKIGYEISFNNYFYRHTPLRSLDVLAQEILELETKNEGLIMEILG